MPGILQKWSFPILTRIKNILGIEGLGILGLKWINVIDQASITGTPPNLMTNIVTIDKDSKPFTFVINTTIKGTRITKQNGNVVGSSDYNARPGALFGSTQAFIDELRRLNMVKIDRLNEIVG